MADWHLPWGQQGATPGLPGRVRLPTQSPQATDGRLPDLARVGHNEGTHSLSADPWRGRHSEAMKRRHGISTTCWGLLSQPDKQELATFRRNLRRLEIGRLPRKNPASGENIENRVAKLLQTIKARKSKFFKRVPRGQLSPLRSSDWLRLLRPFMPWPAPPPAVRRA